MKNMKTRDGALIWTTSSSGSITFHHTSIIGIESEGNKSCVFYSPSTISTQSLIMEDVSVGGVASSSENGGTVKITAGTGGILSVKNSTFDSCEAEAASVGKGGGVYLETLSGCKKFELKSLVLGDNDAYMGKHLFLKCEYLPDVVNRSSFDWYVNVTTKSKTLMGSDSESGDEVVDLFWILNDMIGTPIYVSSSGGNSYYCGTADHICGSFMNALTHLSSPLTHRELNMNMYIDTIFLRPLNWISSTLLFPPTALLLPLRPSLFSHLSQGLSKQALLMRGC
jgi:hypothetical protein